MFEKHDTNNQAELLQLALGSASPLAEYLPGFQSRATQLELAQAVYGTLAGEGALVAQVGTGTGKTLGYLVPLLLSGCKGIISTGSKTLQDQLNDKELPLLKKSLAPELRWALLKGRNNYLCMRKLENFLRAPGLALAGSLSQRLHDFYQHSPDGDLDSIRNSLSPEVMEEITSNSEQCQGSRCLKREQCFLFEARRRAMEADVVVVNHHLFMADLALKAEGHGRLLPRWQAAIFDEAHMLPDIATQAFGVQVGIQRINMLLRDIGKDASSPTMLIELLAASRKASEKLFALLSRMLGPTSGVGLNQGHLRQLAPLLQGLDKSLENLCAHLSSEQDQALAERVSLLQTDLQALPNPLEGRSIVWARTRGSAPAIILSPVEVASHLQATLYSRQGSLVFTSATLAPMDDLTPYMERVGLDSESTAALSLPSPFDLVKQARLYVPRNMPDPADKAFIASLVEQLHSLLSFSQGRAFVLFTSHRNLDAVAQRLQDKTPYTLLVQGQVGRLSLLKQFVEQSPAVLLATASFWQGVDIPGPHLSTVIVDKLPFAPPDDPLISARCSLLEQNGGNGFAHLLVPEAILSLKQGLGRLIRGPEDKGVLAVLDSRVWRKSYGKRFLKALAPMPITDNLDDVENFFKTLAND